MTENINKTENDLGTLQFFDFVYLKSSSVGYTIQTHSFYILFPSCIVDLFENISKLTFLFRCFISVLLRSIAALQFHAFCYSFIVTDYKYLYLTLFLLHLLEAGCNIGILFSFSPSVCPSINIYVEVQRQSSTVMSKYFNHLQDKPSIQPCMKHLPDLLTWQVP